MTRNSIRSPFPSRSGVQRRASVFDARIIIIIITLHQVRRRRHFFQNEFMHSNFIFRRHTQPRAKSTLDDTTRRRSPPSSFDSIVHQPWVKTG